MAKVEYVTEESTVEELKDIAAERHLVGYSSLRKDELIDLINDDIKQENKKAKAEARKAERAKAKKSDPKAKDKVKRKEKPKQTKEQLDDRKEMKKSST